MIKVHIRLSAAGDGIAAEWFDVSFPNLKIDNCACWHYYQDENELYHWAIFYSDRFLYFEVCFFDLQSLL